MSHWTSSPAVPLLLLQLIGRLRGDLVVDQEPRLLPALKGQSAGLRCSYRVSGEEDVFRSVFYWTVRDPGGDLTVIHPAPPARYRGRLELLRESGGRTVTLRIDQLRLNDTESYSCYISFLVNEHSISREGPGSQLFVYAPLRHPMLLYGLLLASSVLILVLVIVIGLTTSSRCSHNRTLHVAARS